LPTGRGNEDEEEDRGEGNEQGGGTHAGLDQKKEEDGVFDFFSVIYGPM
jgi:hypothetical protein